MASETLRELLGAFDLETYDRNRHEKQSRLFDGMLSLIEEQERRIKELERQVADVGRTS